MFWAFNYDSSECNLWAENREVALELSRKFEGFTLLGKSHMPQVCEFRPTRLMILSGGLGRPDVFHAFCFLTLLAYRSGADMGPLLSDTGPLHCLSHALHLQPENIHWRNAIIKSALLLQNIIPGMPPDHIVLPPLSQIDRNKNVPASSKIQDSYQWKNAIDPKEIELQRIEVRRELRNDANERIAYEGYAYLRQVQWYQEYMDEI
jgi:hypothetical protein